MGKLTAKGVEGLTAPGRYTDGDGLTLYVDSAGRRYWQLRYRFSDKRRDLSLGAVRTMTLRDAREAAYQAHALIRSGVDPISARKRRATSGITFAAAAERVHALNVPGWSNGKHQDQWLASLCNHAFPLIGNKSIAEVTRSDVVAVLAPIWQVMPETARRVTQRIEAVIDWAVGEEIREEGLNFKLVKKALPRQVRRVEHMAAVHPAEMPAFMKLFAMSRSTPAIRVAIELMILTASRSANIRFMTWDEVDTDAGVWRIPAAKMKMKRDHLVPLVPRAVELIELMKPHRSAFGDFVFPGERAGKPMSENTKCKAVQALGVDATAHGFRSSFKDWARAARWEDYLSEFQLAHRDNDKSREPYGRDGQLALRREMLTEWAGFIAGTLPAPSWERASDRGGLKLIDGEGVRPELSTPDIGAAEIIPMRELARRRV